MKLLVLLIVGLLLATFVWGYVMEVYYGPMSPQGYLDHYAREWEGGLRFALEEGGKILKVVKKPIPRHGKDLVLE